MCPLFPCRRMLEIARSRPNQDLGARSCSVTQIERKKSGAKDNCARMHREEIFTGGGSGAQRPLGTRRIVDVSREAIVTGENVRYGPGFETKCIDGTSDVAELAAGTEPSISFCGLLPPAYTSVSWSGGMQSSKL